MDTKNQISCVGFKSVRAVVCAFVGLAISQCAPTISGSLQDPQGSAITSEDARVNISRIEPGKPSTYHVVVIDGDGQFSSEVDLSEGDYLVEALVPGYRPNSKRVYLDKSKDINLTLSPLDEVETRSIRAHMQIEADRGQGDVSLTPPQL